MTPALARFFEAVGPYYQGASDLASVTAALGASPSGPVRMAFYQRLMAANRRRILKHVFPVVNAVCEAPERAGVAPFGPWGDLVERFMRGRAAPHWDPNELGRGFAAWLAEGGAPAGVSQLAAWSWQLLASARAPRADASTTATRLDPSVDAAPYPFDVAAWARVFERGEPVVPLPEATVRGPEVVLVTFRDPVALRARVLRPTPAELIVLAEVAGEPPGVPLAARDRATAEARLRTLGLVIGPAS